jgi:hypothetical protein
LTIKRNTVADISDGTTVIGLGDIGPRELMPMMESKAMLFKQLAGVDAFPIYLDTKDPEEIIRIVKAIAPAFSTRPSFRYSIFLKDYPVVQKWSEPIYLAQGYLGNGQIG